MAASLIGHLPTFDDAAEDWPTYIERVELYFLANDIAPEKKVPSLLACVGAKTYSLLRSLVAPVKPSEKSFTEITEVLQNHFCPKPLTIAERFRFYRRDQKGSETVSDFLAELRRLSQTCDFGSFLEEALRDRFVCGLQQEATLKRLLAEPNLTLSRAVELAVAAETASRDAEELQNHLAIPVNHPVHKLQVPPVSDTVKSKRSGVCYRCGASDHYANTCRHIQSVCGKCKKKGHLQRACRSGGGVPQDSKQLSTSTTGNSLGSAGIHELSDIPEASNDFVAYVNIHNMNSKPPSPITVNVQIENVPLNMELDTGSAVSIIPLNCYQRLLSNVQLQPTSLTLKTYSGELLHPAGVIQASVTYEGQRSHENLYVVKEGKVPLFGRDLLEKFKLNWHSINKIYNSSEVKTPSSTLSQETRSKLQNLLTEYDQIFSEDLGTLKNIKAKLHLKPDSVPKFCKARQVPYALRLTVEKELDRLERDGVISKVEWSNWASPIVAVPKPDGTVRICGDFKATVNPCLHVDQYPLPSTDDIFSGLAGGKFFSKVDLRNAYLQMEMEEESKELLTINTHKGLYRYNRLPFGIASAPAIWQRSIDQVLHDLRGVQGLLDDTLVTGSRDSDHLFNLRALFERISAYGLKLKREKCEFFKESLDFCGHRVDENGLHKTEEKVQAIINAPRPCNVHELRSFLGLVNYYSKFLNNASQFLHPLHSLLEKNHPWLWSDACEESYSEAKRQLSSPQVLVHYDPTLPVRLTCDAGPQGIGAVLSHMTSKTDDKPIAFASRSLTKTEQNYSQIDKEALALVWGIKKFYKYLFARHFFLVTDHKPLLSIFHPEKNIPVMTASRLQRYAMFLSGLNYTIEHVSSQHNGHADALSRLPLPQTESVSDFDATDLFHLSVMDVFPVTASDIQRETAHDPVLAQILLYTKEGWNGVPCPPDELKVFFYKRHELSVTCDILMWGSRVCIPKSLQDKLLQELHSSHLGITKMKGLARSFMWWPSMDKDIENVCQKCANCASTRNLPESSLIHPWEFPSAPWRRIHVDFAGPFQDHMFLIVVDAHSKWPEVKIMSTTSTTATIHALREIFSRNGLPEQLVSDNGPQFTSEEFNIFMRLNGIKHIRTAPYHPSTNGLAERFVQTLKNSLKCVVHESSIMEKKLANVLLSYRTAPHATTGQSPASLFLGRTLRTRLSLLSPNIREIVQNKQMQQSFAKQGRNHQFPVGSTVLVRDYRPGRKWAPGRIVSSSGTRLYDIQVDQNVLWKRHLDQILPFSGNTVQSSAGDGTSISDILGSSSTPRPQSLCEIPQREPDSGAHQSLDLQSSPPSQAVPTCNAPTDRYPRRFRKPPERYGL